MGPQEENWDFASGPSLNCWLIDWKSKWGPISLPRVLFCPSPPWVPGVWTLCGPHLLLCSAKLASFSRCHSLLQAVVPAVLSVNPATPICSATCLPVFKYLLATPPLLGISLELLPPTCLQQPPQSFPRATLKMTASPFLLTARYNGGESTYTPRQVG